MFEGRVQLPLHSVSSCQLGEEREGIESIHPRVMLLIWQERGMKFDASAFLTNIGIAAHANNSTS